jgi:hypothetical protein
VTSAQTFALVATKHEPSKVQSVMNTLHDSASSDASADEEMFKNHNVGDYDNVPSSVRSGFIQKVYTLLVMMLTVTTIIAFPFTQLETFPFLADKMLLQTLLIGSFVITIGMSCCCLGMMRTFPMNYIMLAVFSVLYGFIVGVVSAQYTIESVMVAFGMTAGIFLMLTAYACLTKSDFTGMGPYLYAALFGLIMFGFVMMITSFFCAGCYQTMRLVYGALGAILFSFYIVYDTQLIVGGRHKKHQFSVDDFAFAALNLYLDIINLFLMILSLLGDRK